MSLRAFALRFGYSTTAVGLLIVLLVLAALLGSKLFTLDGLTLGCAVAAPLVLATMAITPVALSGRGAVDLSIGPLMSFVNVLLVTQLIGRGYDSPLAVVGAALGLGLVFGIIHGSIVAFVRVQPIVVSLGLYLVFAGLAFETLGQPGGEVPGWLAELAGRSGPVPNAFIVVAAVCAVWVLLDRSALLRNVRVTGGNEVASFASGVHTASARVAAYALGGVLGGLAALMLTALLGSGDPSQGATFTLTAIAALALGGTSLAGGRGGIVGSVVGALDIYLVNYVIGTFDFGEISGPVTQFTYGAILVTALVLGVVTTRSVGLLRRTA